MRTFLGIVFLSSFLAGGLRANLSVVPCAPNSVAYDQAHFDSAPLGSVNGTCANGILNFSGFTFSATGSSGADLLNSSQIELTPIGPPLGQTGNTGFGISGISVPAGQTATYVIDWDFVIDAGPSASGADLGMDPPHGDATVTQYYCVDSFLSAYSQGNPASCSIPGETYAPPVQSLTVTTSNPTAQITFDPAAYKYAEVRTVIQLDGGAIGSLGAGFDAVNGTGTIVTPTPEPVLFAPGGLLILWFWRKRAAGH